MTERGRGNMGGGEGGGGGCGIVMSWARLSWPRGEEDVGLVEIGGHFLL